MIYAIVNASGMYVGAWSETNNPPRPLRDGESVVACEWDNELRRPLGLTLAAPLEPNADWPAFRQTIVRNTGFKRIVECDLVTFTLLNSVMWLIASDPSKAVETVQYWNQLAALAQPTAEEIAELNAIAAEHHVPFLLDEDGMM
jgi:hypothetical protein